MSTNLMMTAQEQAHTAMLLAWAERRAYTVVSINETLTMGRDAAGVMRYNGKP